MSDIDYDCKPQIYKDQGTALCGLELAIRDNRVKYLTTTITRMNVFADSW